jgi:hypothetical protein
MNGILFAAIQHPDDEAALEYPRDQTQKDTCRKFLRLMKSNSTPPGERRSFAHQRVLINTLSGDDRSIFLAACREDFNRTAVFECLAEMKKVYSTMRGNRAALEKNMRALVDRYSDPNSDKISQIKNKLDETKTIMIDNIDKVLERGEKIDGLCEKSELLVHEASHFEGQASSLKWAMYKKKIIMIIVVILILGLIGLIIALVMCSEGGVNFKKCGSSKAPAAAKGTTTTKAPPILM